MTIDFGRFIFDFWKPFCSLLSRPLSTLIELLTKTNKKLNRSCFCSFLIFLESPWPPYSITQLTTIVSLNQICMIKLAQIWFEIDTNINSNDPKMLLPASLANPLNLDYVISRPIWKSWFKIYSDMKFNLSTIVFDISGYSGFLDSSWSLHAPTPPHLDWIGNKIYEKVSYFNMCFKYDFSQSKTIPLIRHDNPIT